MISDKSASQYENVSPAEGPRRKNLHLELGLKLRSLWLSSNGSDPCGEIVVVFTSPSQLWRSKMVTSNDIRNKKQIWAQKRFSLLLVIFYSNLAFTLKCCKYFF